MLSKESGDSTEDEISIIKVCQVHLHPFYASMIPSLNTTLVLNVQVKDIYEQHTQLGLHNSKSIFT